MRFITTLCASFRDYLRGWLDSCRPLTADVAAKMRTWLDKEHPEFPRESGIRLSGTVPTINTIDPAAPRDSLIDSPQGCNSPAEPFPLPRAETDPPVLDGTEAIAPRGLSYTLSPASVAALAESLNIAEGH